MGIGGLVLTRQMSLGYARDNIRVWDECFGTVETKTVRTVAENEVGDLDKILMRYAGTHPIGRICSQLILPTQFCLFPVERRGS